MHDHDTNNPGRALRSGPEPTGMSLEARCERMGAIAAEYRRAGPLADEGFAALLLADLIEYVEGACEQSIRHHLGWASVHLCAELDQRDIRSHTDVLLAGEDLPVAQVRDAEARAERFGQVLAAIAPGTGTDPDELATDIATDLWIWCQHRDIPGPDVLLPTAEVLHLMANGSLH